MGNLFSSSSTYHVLTTILGLSTLGFIIVLRRFFPKIPWGIASIVLATFISWAFHLDVPTIGSRFGALPSHLPTPHFHFDLSRVFELLPDAITIALLAGIESLLSAVIADAATGGRHKPNCELVAQGIANLGAVMFGGIPATAAIARTATNIKTGAQTPVAGMIHAVVLFVLLLTCSSVVLHIPLASLAAILVVVAWNMSELPPFFTADKNTRGRCRDFVHRVFPHHFNRSNGSGWSRRYFSCIFVHETDERRQTRSFPRSTHPRARSRSLPSSRPLLFWSDRPAERSDAPASSISSRAFYLAYGTGASFGCNSSADVKGAP